MISHNSLSLFSLLTLPQPILAACDTNLKPKGHICVDMGIISYHDTIKRKLKHETQHFCDCATSALLPPFILFPSRQEESSPAVQLYVTNNIKSRVYDDIN
jgi:hypothetical protein